MHPQKSPTSTHITRKRRVFYYRRRLPRPLGGEFSISLRTRNYRRAEHLASCLDTKLSGLLRDAVNETEIANILRGYLGNLLMDNREIHWTTKAERSVFGLLVQPDEDPTDDDLTFIDEQIGEHREAIGRRDGHRVVRVVNELMEAHAITQEYRPAITEGVLAANIRALKVMRLRLLGRLEGAIFSEQPIESPVKPVSAAVGQTISELIRKRPVKAAIAEV